MHTAQVFSSAETQHCHILRPSSRVAIYVSLAPPLDGVPRLGAPAADARPVHVQQEIIRPVCGGSDAADDIPFEI